MTVVASHRRQALLAWLALSAGAMAPSAWSQAAAAPPATGVLIENVRIFDGLGDQRSAPSNVLVVGDQIKAISAAPIAEPANTTVTRIAGGGRTLMPGLIDAHTHMMFGTVPQLALLTADVGFMHIAAGRGATEMLMRGFTSVRDLGGPVFGLKLAIDSGVLPGPRIWPAGGMISQSGGHGDFRLPTELPARPGDVPYGDRIGGSYIADDADKVRQRTRELLALGASHIKLMAGGGVSSSFDPLDVTQYSVPEIRAAVEAAENWGTYVTVHAYTPRAVRQAIEAGVKCIDHGNLLDDDTAKLMADKGVWWSLQPFLDDQPSAFAEGTPNRVKQLTMFGGTDSAYAAAKKHKIKTAWGTDTLFSAKNSSQQGRQLAKMTRWYTPVEALRMATSGNAALLALSGLRSPYPGKLGVVQEGALADLLLVDGDPLTDLNLVADAAKNFVVIMKDGQVYKNTLKP